MNTMIHRRLDALEVIANLSTASTESVTTRIENLIEHFASHEDESNRVREIVASIIKTRKHYSDEITSEEIFDWIFWPTVLRSEEHTSELQSRFDLVCRLLLEKKNNSMEL